MNFFQRYLAEEFAEDYQEGRLTRREALKMIASVTGSLLLANSFLAACTPQETQEAAQTPAVTSSPAASSSETPAAASIQAETPAGSAALNATVSPDDPAVAAGALEFPGEGGTLVGYLSRPLAEGSYPAILVCHENRGLTPYIEDVTRRLAKAGYVALAVDLLSRQGGTAALSSGEVPGVLGSIPPEQFVSDFESGRQHLAGQSFSQIERLGMMGFCFGGGVTWLSAARMPQLKAAVPFYGPNPPLEEVPNIQAAVLAIYGALDQRIDQGIPAIEAAMQAAGKVFEYEVYAGADHAFHNDTGSRYNPEAAQAAWGRALAWFEQYV